MMNKNFNNKNVPKKSHETYHEEKNLSIEDSQTFKNISSSKENVELSLEVEIANSLQQLLTKPENCTSRLLDVTIIRPSKDCSNIDRIETNTVAFGKDDIKDLLTIIEKQNLEFKEKRHRKYCKQATSVSAKPKYEFKTCKRHDGYISPRRNAFLRSAHSNLNPLKRNCASNPYPSYLRNVEARLIEVCNNHIENSASQIDVDFSSDSDVNQRIDTTIGDGSNAHHIYAAAHTFDKLRKSLACQNKHHRTDGKSPCLCEHCGTMGVLIESQKGPVLTNVHAPLWSTGPTRQQTKCSAPQNTSNSKYRYVDLRTKHKGDYTMHNINVRLKDLEERLVQQEEQSVNKEYFKKIMSKLITYCHNKNHLSNNINNADLKNNSVQCNFNETKYNGKKDVKSSTLDKRHCKSTDQSYCINSIFVHAENEEKDSTPKVSNQLNNKKATPIKSLDTFWKWGEEIIKPGVDLKTKILSLLDEKLNNAQSKMCNENCTRHGDKDYKCKYCKTNVVRCSTSSLTNALMDKSTDDSQKRNDNNTKNSEKKSQINLTKSQFEPILMKHNDKNLTGKPLHVAYVSPNVKNWKIESTTSITKIKVKDNATQISNDEPKIVKKRLSVQDSLQDKLNCLRELARSRNVDENQLWRNIWYKVKDHARTKHDTVTIQIPTETLYKLHKGVDQISEIELTITDLFDIVVRSKENSLATIDVDTRSVINNRKRLEEIHKQLGIILNKQLSKN